MGHPAERSALHRAHAKTLGALDRLKEANQELVRRNESLARSNEDLQQFAYAVSQDLQAPLRNVGAYAELLARRNKGILDADSKEFVNFIVEGVGNMNSLIRGLLVYSKATHEAGDVVLTDTKAVVDVVLHHLQCQIQHCKAS